MLLAVSLTGCSAKPERVVIRGSNTFGEELAPRLVAEYRKDRPGVDFDLEFKGTSYGLGALMVERCDIAAASRETTPNELYLARDRDIAFNDYPIGFYSVVVIVNAGNSVGNLTLEQVRDIFTGTFRNWKEAGGPDAPIHLYVRDPISGTHLGFQELAMEKKAYALGLKAFTNYSDIVQTVAGDANGIGYSSFDLANKSGVKAVSIGGEAPTVLAVTQRRYPYSRVLRFYTIKGTESLKARQFIRFVQSPHGQEIVERMGYVPHP